MPISLYLLDSEKLHGIKMSDTRIMPIVDNRLNKILSSKSILPLIRRFLFLTGLYSYSYIRKVSLKKDVRVFSESPHPSSIVYAFQTSDKNLILLSPGVPGKRVYMYVYSLPPVDLYFKIMGGTVYDNWGNPIALVDNYVRLVKEELAYVLEKRNTKLIIY